MLAILYNNTANIQQSCDQLLQQNNLLQKRVIKESIYTAFLFLYKFWPLNVVFAFLKFQSHLKYLSLMYL